MANERAKRTFRTRTLYGASEGERRYIRTLKIVNCLFNSRRCKNSLVSPSRVSVVEIYITSLAKGLVCCSEGETGSSTPYI